MLHRHGDEAAIFVELEQGVLIEISDVDDRPFGDGDLQRIGIGIEKYSIFMEPPLVRSQRRYRSMSSAPPEAVPDTSPREAAAALRDLELTGRSGDLAPRARWSATLNDRCG